MCYIWSQTKRNISGLHLPLYLLAAYGIICCHGCLAVAGNASRAAQPEPFLHERRAGEFPSLFIPWGDPIWGGRPSSNRIAAESLLLSWANADLGLNHNQ